MWEQFLSPRNLAFLLLGYLVAMTFFVAVLAGVPDWPIEQLILLSALVFPERTPGGRWIARHVGEVMRYYEERPWRFGLGGVLLVMIPFVNLLWLGRPVVLVARAVALSVPLELLGSAVMFYLLPNFRVPFAPEHTFGTAFLTEAALTVAYAPFLVMFAVHLRRRVGPVTSALSCGCRATPAPAGSPGPSGHITTTGSPAAAASRP